MVALDVRSMVDDDLDDVLALLHLSLGWEPNDRFRRYFEWKHRSSPFGPSPGWIAELDGNVVGVRLFQRWELATPGGSVVRAVRAVDTATHPDAQGQGVFRTLTMSAVEELTAEGVDVVFNTPNSKSMPGYLKMGWRIGGRFPVGMLPRPTPTAVLRLVRARTGAERWPLASDVGEPFSIPAASPSSPTDGLATPRSDEFLTWRYGWPDLGYRSWSSGDATVIWRLRRRGPATELTISDTLGEDTGRTGPARLLEQVGADMVLSHRGAGLLPAPHLGPVVTIRSLAGDVEWTDLRFSMGDIELF